MLKNLFIETLQIYKVINFGQVIQFEDGAQSERHLFCQLLSFLSKILPEGNEMPSSFYELKKTLSILGMVTKKIHVCTRNFILYRKEFKDATTCLICYESRWKKKKNSDKDLIGILAKELWYMPIAPRFVKLFQNSDHAKKLT